MADGGAEGQPPPPPHEQELAAVARPPEGERRPPEDARAQQWMLDRDRKFQQPADQHNLYCCAECCVRTGCAPCMLLGCVPGVPGCFCTACGWVLGMLFCCSDCDHPPTQRDLCAWCCCLYKAVDRNVPLMTCATVGALKYDADRTEDERLALTRCGDVVRRILCCGCDLCSWLWDVPCVQWIRFCCVNLGTNIDHCGRGLGEGCRIVGRRCCCMGPQRQIM